MFKCDNCGKFISNIAIRNGEARHVMISPDSEWSYEEWETLCPKCTKFIEDLTKLDEDANERIYMIKW